MNIEIVKCCITKCAVHKIRDKVAHSKTGKVLKNARQSLIYLKWPGKKREAKETHTHTHIPLAVRKHHAKLLARRTHTQHTL